MIIHGLIELTFPQVYKIDGQESCEPGIQELSSLGHQLQVEMMSHRGATGPTLGTVSISNRGTHTALRKVDGRMYQPADISVFLKPSNCKVLIVLTHQIQELLSVKYVFP